MRSLATGCVTLLKGTYLDMLPILHCQSVHLIYDKQLNRGKEIRVPVMHPSVLANQRMGMDTYFSFSIDILRPRGLANMMSEV